MQVVGRPVQHLHGAINRFHSTGAGCERAQLKSLWFVPAIPKAGRYAGALLLPKFKEGRFTGFYLGI
jgi:hypothetical protein